MTLPFPNKNNPTRHNALIAMTPYKQQDMIIQILLTVLVSALSIITPLGLIPAQYSPPTLLFPVIGLLVLASAIYKLSNMLWKEASPNEWMLVIQGGELRKAGIGIKGYFPPWQNVVTFPSKIHKVEFTANNITKEYQGIEVKGFGIYSVYRTGDGPFKYYRYMSGQSNTHIANLCECVVRKSISVSTIDQVLYNRAEMRDTMLNTIRKVLEGWGIWLETVEINSVEICSSTTFKDKQAETRLSANYQAQIIRMDNKLQNRQKELQAEITLKRETALNETKKFNIALEQDLKRKVSEAQYFKNTIDLKVKALQQTTQLRKANLQKAKNMRQSVFEKDKATAEMDNTNQIEKIANQIETEKKQMQAINMEKYELESLGRIFQEASLKEINYKQFIGPEQLSGGIASILPALSMLQKQVNS